MVVLALLNYRLSEADRNTPEWAAWHAGWASYHRRHAQIMRRTVQGERGQNLRIASACYHAASQHVKDLRRTLQAIESADNVKP